MKPSGKKYTPIAGALNVGFNEKGHLIKKPSGKTCRNCKWWIRNQAEYSDRNEGLCDNDKAGQDLCTDINFKCDYWEKEPKKPLIKSYFPTLQADSTVWISSDIYDPTAYAICTIRNRVDSRMRFSVEELKKLKTLLNNMKL